MKHRWMDVVKRSTSALTLSSSPRSVDSSSKDTASTSSVSKTRRKSFLLALQTPTGDGEFAMDTDTPESDMDHVLFMHYEDRCVSVGECSVPKVLEHCMLQGGVHHTHMNILTYLGNPLRIETCCYTMRVQWFRALTENDDFQLIPDVCDEWFTPTADDIGAKILAKVMLHDEDAIRTKLLEYGPIKEDPEVRSKVELYLERRSVLLMGLESVAVQDGGEHYPNNIDMQESWTLLIDDRRVRLTCESSLLPPFEGFYTSSIRVEIVRSTPHEFYLYLADNCYVHLRAESNTVRDIIVLTLRAFCKSAVSSELINEAISKGISPMLTIRTLAAAEQQQQQLNGGATSSVIVKSPLSYNLPWNRSHPNASTIIIDDNDDDSDEDEHEDDGESEEVLSQYGGASIFHRPRTASDCVSVTSCDFYNDSVLQDAEALIGNAMKMGLQQVMLLPKAPKRISVTEIPDLQIIEAMVPGNNGEGASLRRRRQRSQKLASDSDWRSRSSSLDVQASGCVSENGDDVGGLIPAMNGDSIDEAIERFQRDDFTDIDALRTQYVAIFCELQRELSEYKTRANGLKTQLEETTEANKAFKNDIATLQDALSSVQIAQKVKELVADDLGTVLKSANADTDGNTDANFAPTHFY